MKRLERFARSLRAFSREITRAPQPKVVVPEFRRPRIGLAFGGGFARGIAHIGALKVFEEEKIPIDFVAGTSVGSIIGAAFCNGTSARELAEIALMVRFKH